MTASSMVLLTGTSAGRISTLSPTRDSSQMRSPLASSRRRMKPRSTDSASKAMASTVSSTSYAELALMSSRASRVMMPKMVLL
jgi:hypothetical protein